MLPSLLRSFLVLLASAPLLSAAGLSWTQVNTGATAGLQYTAGAYGGGRYVFLAYGNASGGGFTTEAVSSADGSSWTKSTLPNGAIARGITYANGLFVAPGEFNGADVANPNTIMTSPDGATWTARNAGSGSLWNVAYNGEKFVAVGLENSGNNAAVSADGITWTRVAIGNGSTTLSSIIAYPYLKRFIAWNASFDTYYTSTDGTTWTSAKVTGRPSGYYWGFAVTDSGFVALTSAPGETTARLHESSDGLTWTDRQTLDLPTGFSGTGHNSLGITHFPSTGQATAVVIGGAFDSNFNNTPYALDSAGPLTSWNTQSFGTGSFVENRFVRFLGGSWWIGNSTTQLFNSAGISGGGNSGGSGGGNSGGNSGGGGSGSALTAGHFTNLSIRANAGTGDNTLILGFVIAGSDNTAKQLLVRAAGPALAAYNVGGALADPLLKVFAGSDVLADNNDWGSAANAADITAAAQRLGAFTFTAGAKDAAVLLNAARGALTAHVSGGNGVALIELYDADTGLTTASPLFRNASGRAVAGSGDNTLNAGFVIGGSEPQRVLVRAVGPGLAAYNVSGTLADPRLEIRSGSTTVATNDDWTENSAAAADQNAAGAFALTAGSKDAAVIATLPPGVYNVVVSGATAATGVVLVELYHLP